MTTQSPTSDYEIRGNKEIQKIVERDAMALCCNECDGGGYDYENTKNCPSCNGTGLSEWNHEYLVTNLTKYVQQERLRAKIEELDQMKLSAQLYSDMSAQSLVIRVWLENRRADLTKQLKEYEAK